MERGEGGGRTQLLSVREREAGTELLFERWQTETELLLPGVNRKRMLCIPSPACVGLAVKQKLRPPHSSFALAPEGGFLYDRTGGLHCGVIVVTCCVTSLVTETNAQYRNPGVVGLISRTRASFAAGNDCRIDEISA